MLCLQALGVAHLLQIKTFEVIRKSVNEKPINPLFGKFDFPHQILQSGCGISKFDGRNHSLQLVSFGLARSLASRLDKVVLQVASAEGPTSNSC